MTDAEIVAYVTRHYCSELARLVEICLTFDGEFAGHVRRSFVREIERKTEVTA